MPKLGIRTRFTLILSVIFIVAIIAAWAVFSQVLQQRAEAQISDQAGVLMSMLNSVRSYTNEEVNPLLADRLANAARLHLGDRPGIFGARGFQPVSQRKSISTLRV